MFLYKKISTVLLILGYFLSISFLLLYYSRKAAVVLEVGVSLDWITDEADGVSCHSVAAVF